jgi:hypothetical protein
VPIDIDPHTATYGDLRMMQREHGLRLQSFPPGFTLYGNQNLMAEQIGNAVPPLLAYDVGNALHEALCGARGRLSSVLGDATTAHLTEVKALVYGRVPV